MRSPRLAAVQRHVPAPVSLEPGPMLAAEAPVTGAEPVMPSSLDIAQYECDVLLQLRDLARRADLKFLAYLLEMAFEEAFTQANQLAGKE